MNINLVTISLDHYNELRDFKDQITSGKVCSQVFDLFGEIKTIRFYTENEAVEEFSIENELLKMENSRLKSDKANMKNISLFKQMSLYEFWKWRKL